MAICVFRGGCFVTFKSPQVFPRPKGKSCVQTCVYFSAKTKLAFSHRLSFPYPPKDKGDLFKLGSKFRYTEQLRKEGFTVDQDNHPTSSRVTSRIAEI